METLSRLLLIDGEPAHTLLLIQRVRLQPVSGRPDWRWWQGGFHVELVFMALRGASERSGAFIIAGVPFASGRLAGLRKDERTGEARAGAFFFRPGIQGERCKPLVGISRIAQSERPRSGRASPRQRDKISSILLCITFRETHTSSAMVRHNHGTNGPTAPRWHPWPTVFWQPQVL